MITGNDDTPCARHTCGHSERRHRRRGNRREYVVEECLVDGCPCTEYLEEPVCKGIPPVVAEAPSGKRYERCACGAVKGTGVMVMDPDHPAYGDDADDRDQTDVCKHGVPYDEDCEDCEIEDEDDLDEPDDLDDDEDLDDFDDDDFDDEDWDDDEED